jgi:hypothetical protein
MLCRDSSVFNYPLHVGIVVHGLFPGNQNPTLHFAHRSSIPFYNLKKARDYETDRFHIRKNMHASQYQLPLHMECFKPWRIQSPSLLTRSVSTTTYNLVRSEKQSIRFESYSSNNLPTIQNQRILFITLVSHRATYMSTFAEVFFIYTPHIKDT